MNPRAETKILLLLGALFLGLVFLIVDREIEKRRYKAMQDVTEKVIQDRFKEYKAKKKKAEITIKRLDYSLDSLARVYNTIEGQRQAQTQYYEGKLQKVYFNYNFQRLRYLDSLRATGAMR